MFSIGGEAFTCGQYTEIVAWSQATHLDYLMAYSMYGKERLGTCNVVRNMEVFVVYLPSFPVGLSTVCMQLCFHM